MMHHNLGGSRQVLILEGTSMAGTEAAADFVLDDGALLPFLNKIRRPDGSIPNFEVLLQSTSLDENASQSKTVALPDVAGLDIPLILLAGKEEVVTQNGVHGKVTGTGSAPWGLPEIATFQSVRLQVQTRGAAQFT